MPFPNIDPIIFEIGPFALRWYALAYMAGLILGWKYMVALTKRPALWPQGVPANEEQIDDLLLWVTLGVIVGGRLGYVLREHRTGHHVCVCVCVVCVEPRTAGLGPAVCFLWMLGIFLSFISLTFSLVSGDISPKCLRLGHGTRVIS